ncbi:hypothetical protein ACP4OV_002500 [Aristida adscensionis]
MGEPHHLSAARETASSSSLDPSGTITGDLAASVPGPSMAERPRVAPGPPAPGRSFPDPEAEVPALALMSGGLYPLAREGALRGLASVLEKADACGGVGRRVVECCYRCAVERMRDEDEGVRLAAVRLVGLCAEKLAVIVDSDASGDGAQMDLIFLQLSSMARDMSTRVRIEAFGALGKMNRVSEGVLLQSLSKKVIKTVTSSGSIVNGIKLPPKLKLPCAAGIFAHGIEDEFYQVRTAACKSMGALAKFSSQYSQKALDLLMDMMNDDTEVVRLQTLQALFDMATYGCLSVQEMHMHMHSVVTRVAEASSSVLKDKYRLELLFRGILTDNFLGLLVDANALIRDAARKILGLVNLPKLQMFKSAVDGLITSMERYPEEQDIYGVLFSIGKNHGSFSANIAKHLAKEISTAPDGELILDKPRIKALLIVSISTPFSDDKHKKLDIPSIIFSHAISLLGKVSCALGDVVNQDALLSYLCHKGGMPFWDCKSASAGSGESEAFSVEAIVGSNTENTAKEMNYLDEVLIMRSVKSILETVEGAWTMTMLLNVCEIRTMLRTCKEELMVLARNSSGSIGAFLSFLCEYLDAIWFVVEIWQLVQLRNSYAFGQTSLDILLEQLDVSIRRMEWCYDRLTRELEVQVLELALLANLFRLSKIGINSKLVLDKLFWVINRLEALCADGSCELSDFSRETKKAFDDNSFGDALINKICTLPELFRLKPTTDFGMLKAVMGVSFNISLWNISSHHRLWLRMVAGESIQHTFLELSSFEGSEEAMRCSIVVPLYATPMVSSFVMRVCLVMECPYGGTSTHRGGHGGPSDCVVQLSDELDVYFVSIEQR